MGFNVVLVVIVVVVAVERPDKPLEVAPNHLPALRISLCIWKRRLWQQQQQQQRQSPSGLALSLRASLVEFKRRTDTVEASAPVRLPLLEGPPVWAAR